MPQSDPEGLQAVFERHFEAVYGYVAYRLAPDVDAAGDVTQEVFLAALKGWAGYRRNGRPLAWLRGIARRKVADHYRGRLGGEGHRSLGAAKDLPAADATDRQARAAAIAAVMRSLPADYAELLEEKYLDGLSVRQMARRRDTTEKAVESALTRARAAFRDAYRTGHRTEEDHHV